MVIANKKEKLKWFDFKLYGWGSHTCDSIPYSDWRLRYGYLHLDSFVDTLIRFNYNKGGSMHMKTPICLRAIKH